MGSDTIQEIQAFVLSIPKSAGLLFVMHHFILHLLKDTRKLSSGLCEITSAMFKRLERHNAGITYLRHLRSLEGSENILSTLLTLSEIMFDNFSSAEMDTSESAADTENPLTSITQVKIFERLIAEIASTTLINVEETFKGETEFIRYLWLFAKNEERKGRLNQALTYYSECLERLESAGGFISLNYW